LHAPHARRARRTAPLFVALLGALALAAPAAAQTRAAPPYPGALGPVPFGHTKYTLVDHDRADRTMEVQVWYPIDPDQANGPHAFYRLGFGTLGVTSAAGYEGKPPATRPAMPLVVFSHGSGGVNVQSIDLMETLASHGFVVAAPNHTGNTAIDFLLGTTESFALSAVHRPQDVSFVIDDMARRANDPTSPFYARVNTFKVAVVGHSFGGYTALAVASGVATVPPDPRVRVIVPTAPASFILSDSQLASIDVPMLVLGGTLDTTTPVEPNSARPFALVAGRPAIRVDITGAMHLHFSNACELGSILLANGLDEEVVFQLVDGYEETCGPGAYPVAEAHRLQDLYTVAFIRRHLLGDMRYERFLTPAYALANEPTVTVWRKDVDLPFWWAWYLALYSR
ncbi:MAG TPA: dienelactone hydrolase family protein, partial [Dongiaceae bacterium]|nr:dienelactone hydrolase family protein [Dongiaceae bacterium]